MMNRTFIIAEAGVNHNGKFALAEELIVNARKCGADAIKFQTYRTEKLVAAKAPLADYQKEGGKAAKTQFELLKSLELSQDEFLRLNEIARKNEIQFLSTPFDFESVDFLEPIVALYKIGSSDCNNYPFLEYVARKGKPVILSTGMADVNEISRAVEAIKRYNVPLSLLHCTTSYPCPYRDANLQSIPFLKSRFGGTVGFSDHTQGIEAAVAAVALGAAVIEKHYTLDKSMDGPDHAASLDSQELRQMILSIRNVEMALGVYGKTVQSIEEKIRTVARKSIVYNRCLKAGTVLTGADLSVKRPGTGVAPERIAEVIGKSLKRNVEEDTLFEWTDL